MKRTQHYDAAILGGGIYGVTIALRLRELGFKNIVIFEKNPVLMGQATLKNQARIHNGYHYPRSFTTAYRSHVNFHRFINDFPNCIYDAFDSYYAVAKNGSITANQFKTVMERIGSPISEAPLKIKSYFNQHLVEEVYKVQEYVFDSVKLAKFLSHKLRARKIKLMLSAKAIKVEKEKDDIRVFYKKNNSEECINATYVFNTTYSQTNQVLTESNLPLIRLKHELAEIALVKAPSELKYAGITIVDGPFFSLMPFPPKGIHTLSHVRYTPHAYWYDANTKHADNAVLLEQTEKKSNFSKMLKDASRYLPIINRCFYQESLWEIKTVLPQNEIDDGRPILFKKNHGMTNFICVMGGKIDNIYDVLDELENL